LHPPGLADGAGDVALADAAQGVNRTVVSCVCKINMLREISPDSTALSTNLLCLDE
jgi:hypothetical protein